jgi:hypothetical protein
MALPGDDLVPVPLVQTTQAVTIDAAPPRVWPWPFRAYAVPIVLIWGEVITARNFLRGIKRRAEAAAR